MRRELKAIEAKLIELLGNKATEVRLLKARLSCHHCKNFIYANNIYNCNLYGEIPKDFVTKGCDSWITDISKR